MRRKIRKQINLRDNKEMLELMKQLYGSNEAKDEQAHIDTKRESRAKVAREVVEHSSTT